jgi:hypothetical protein
MEKSSEVAKFVGFGTADSASGIVFGGVALGTTGVEVIGVVCAFCTQD